MVAIAAVVVVVAVERPKFAVGSPGRVLEPALIRSPKTFGVAAIHWTGSGIVPFVDCTSHMRVMCDVGLGGMCVNANICRK